MKQIKDKETGETFEAYDFGGPDVFQVDSYWIYGQKRLNYTGVNKTKNSITLNPFNLTIDLMDDNPWEVIDYGNPDSCTWRITVKHLGTGQEISGVYPFNLEGTVYQLPCGGEEWVMASCGGLEISEGDGSPICYTLVGTGETIRLVNFRTYGRKYIRLLTPMSWSHAPRADFPVEYQTMTFQWFEDTNGGVKNWIFGDIIVSVEHVPTTDYYPYETTNDAGLALILAKAIESYPLFIERYLYTSWIYLSHEAYDYVAVFDNHHTPMTDELYEHTFILGSSVIVQVPSGTPHGLVIAWVRANNGV